MLAKTGRNRRDGPDFETASRSGSSNAHDTSTQQAVDDVVVVAQIIHQELDFDITVPSWKRCRPNHRSADGERCRKSTQEQFVDFLLSMGAEESSSWL